MASLGDCDTCNAVILVVIFIATGLFFMWSRNQNQAAVAVTKEPVAAAPEKKKKKAKKPVEKKAAPVIEKIEEESEEAVEPEVEAEAPKKKKKKNKKKKAVEAEEPVVEEKVAPKKEQPKKKKEKKPKQVVDDEPWTTVEDTTTKAPEPEAAKPQPAAKKPAKPAPKPVQKSPDAYLASLPEEIRAAILSQNSQAAQLAQQAKSNADHSAGDWIEAKDESARHEKGNAPSAAKDANAGASADSAASKPVELPKAVERVYKTVNIWQQMHDEGADASNPSVKLDGKILDYSW